MEDPILAGAAGAGADKKHRRPRVRQVSSRFMSPFAGPTPNSSAAADHRRSPSRASDPLSSYDPNRRADTPFPTPAPAKPAPQRRVAVKLFKENGVAQSDADPVVEVSKPPVSQKGGVFKLSGRPRLRIDTPSAGLRASSGAQSITASPKVRKCVEKNSESFAGELSEEESTADNFSESETCSVGSQPNSCDSPPIPSQKNRTVTAHEVRSTMPEMERLPARHADPGEHSRVSATPWQRSSSLGLSSSLSKSVIRSAGFLSSCSRPAAVQKVGLLPPPHPGQLKPGMAEARKGKCSSSYVEDVLDLKLLYNRHLQWRYVNAKSVASSKTQKNVAEKMLHNAMEEVSKKREIMVEKRKQLAKLKMEQTLSTLLKSQLPCLDEWSSLEEDFSVSLAETSTALVNATTLLPICGDTMVNISDLDDVFSSMTGKMETINSSLKRFTSKASGLNIVSTDVALIVTRERALIEECNSFLSRAHMLMVEESSLRSQLIELKNLRVT